MISDDAVFSEATSAAISYSIFAALTFRGVREVWSAATAGTIKSRLGLVAKDVDAQTFRKLVWAERLMLGLSVLILYATSDAMAQHVLLLDAGWPGIALFIGTLAIIVLLAARYRRKARWTT